jgi:O-acetyl-ADP-ribose deacetylase (regulator of RNase III)
VISAGHGLANPYVIHCLGPVYGIDEPAEFLLESCYRRALELADAHNLPSIAFPAISTGAFGFPMAAAARIALGTVVCLRSDRATRPQAVAGRGPRILAAHAHGRASSLTTGEYSHR